MKGLFRKGAFFGGMMFLLLSCQSKQTFKIGLLASFSGPIGEMGEEARNALFMAIREANDSGGIKGRPIELLIQDDQGSPESAGKGAQALIDLGVEVIIGPFTSATTEAALEVCEKAQILLFSPSASSSVFLNKDDMLFRRNTTARENGEQSAEWILNEYGFKKGAIIWDQNNAKYAEDWKEGFRDYFTDRNGIITADLSIDSGADSTVSPAAERAVFSDPNVIVLIGNSFFSASIAQQIFKLSDSIKLFGAELALISATELIALGGKAVEGMDVLILFDTDNINASYEQFREQYRGRFKMESTSTAAISYETVNIVIAGFRNQKRNQSIKDAITQGSPYKGFFSDVHINEYGDSSFDRYFGTIMGGQIDMAP